MWFAISWPVTSRRARKKCRSRTTSSCARKDPLVYATAAERMLAAIGEPETGRHPPRPAAVAHLRQQDGPHLPGLQGFLRSRGADRTGRLALPPCRAGPGGEEADPVPAGPRGRRQVVDRRAPEAADGAGAVLRHQGLAGERVAAGPVQQRRGRPAPGAAVRHPAPLHAAHHVAVGRQAPARNSAATSASSRSSSAIPSILKQVGIAKTEPGDENNQDISLAGRQDRHPQARDLSRRTTPTPTATPAACAWPTRACWNSSRCSRRRSRCCTRC